MHLTFLQDNGAPFELSDFAEFYAKIEEPTHAEYRGYTVYKQDFGSQGPVLLQTLNILEQFDLQAMGHNSPDYVHTITEAMKLALRGPRHVLRGPGVCGCAGCGAAVKGVCQEARSRDRPRPRVGRLQGWRSAAL